MGYGPVWKGTQVLCTPAAHHLGMGQHHSGLRTAGRAQDAHCGAWGILTLLEVSPQAEHAE